MNAERLPFPFPVATWTGQAVRLIDQTLLPHRLQWQTLDSLETFCRAIGDMQVRGAPLIGITAAFGLARAPLSSNGCRPAGNGRESPAPQSSRLEARECLSHDSLNMTMLLQIAQLRPLGKIGRASCRERV